MAEYIWAATFWSELLTTLPNRNFYCEAVRGLISYCSRIRKNVTDREQTDRQTEKPITEAILILMDRWDERANT